MTITFDSTSISIAGPVRSTKQAPMELEKSVNHDSINKQSLSCKNTVALKSKINLIKQKHCKWINKSTSKIV